MSDYDITGKRFGYWTVIQRDKPHPNTRNSYWICRCDCGEVRAVNRSTLISGRSKSCGCMPIKRTGINKTHGLSNTRIYKEWLSMRQRTKIVTGKTAKSYSLRGIHVCDEWENDFISFYAWAIENGYNDSLTIDRIDNDKGYCPDNCRWVTIEEQQSNKQNTVLVDYGGEKWCLRTLCESVGFPYKTAHRRYLRMMNRGDTIDTNKLIAPVDESKIAFRFRKP